MSSSTSSSSASPVVRIGDLTPAMSGLNIEAIILEHHGGPTSNVHKFIIADSSGSCILWVWGDAALQLAPMQIIQLSGAYTKLYRDQISVYVKKEGGRIVRTGEFRMLFSKNPQVSEYRWKSFDDGKTFTRVTEQDLLMMQQQQQPMMMVNVMPIEQPLPVSPVPLPPLPPAPEQDRVIPASVESTERTERLIKEQEEIEDKSLLEWTNIADKIAAGLVPPENRLQLIELLEAFVAENQQNPAKLAAEPQLAKVVGTISNSLSKLKQVQPTPVPQPPAPVPQQTTNIAYQQPTPVPIQPRPVYQQQYPMQRPMMMPMQTIPHQPYPVHPQFIQPAGMVQPRPVGIMQAQPGMIQPAGMMPQYVNPMMQASQYFPIGAAAQMANLTPVPLLNVQPAFQQQQTPALKQQPARTKRTAAATAATVPETATPSQQQGRQKKQRTVAAVKDNPLLIAHTLPSRSTLSYADIDSSPEKPKSKSTGKKAKQTPAAPVGRPSESLLSYADLDDAPEPGEVLSSSEND